MVRALVLLAPGGAPPAPPGPAPPGPAPCRLLLARAFGTPPATPPGTPPGTPRRRRLRRKEQLLVVARQVSSQCHLLRSSSARSSPPQLPHPPDDPASFQDSPGGLFRLPPGDPFPEGVTVAWLQVGALALALVCDPQENLCLAQITLRRLAPRLLASLRIPGAGAEVLLRPDAADLLLDRLLPQGQMLFLNEGFLRALDREMGRKTSR